MALMFFKKKRLQTAHSYCILNYTLQYEVQHMGLQEEGKKNSII